ncbi:iron ABC transporter permease [Paenibacillus sp. FSL R7-0048]|jgi:iron complex transport system permease protein|uniref:FecCD family ABC transporter permease n=1 Tax=Paenibacillus TaxID=44249 RepID=UPI00096C652D|nr:MULTISPECIES: iron ABC transporter permease [Paenibacillus]MDH6425893.1 iron complex transport system permease protein [Paenibacillus sp. PastH-4]MDH6441914.1 iron complex transport system permease protein [Paenibacillus sp. PastF-4]MDH6527371.1 iron complex transport system permease protein [Paenibacillus sp. PastH-3]OMD57111.1 iron ABC transporter [Paenibacillus odorifer]OMD66254.1 iron ABC transporter [Paenibacillus odorifer]
MTTKQTSIPFFYKLLGSVLVMVICLVIAMLFGAKETTLHDLWLAITSSSTADNVLILREIRLPRELAAMLIGAAFAVSGAIMQGVTRNPLADPGLLGLTSGANMALALTFVFMPGLNYFGTMIACFFGAALGAVLVLILGSVRQGGLSPIRIVLAGAAVSAFLYAIASGVSIAFKISKDVSMWTAGGLIGTTWGQLQAIAPVILIGIVVALIFSNQLTILSLSDEVAIGLGQNLVLVKGILFTLIILLTGASVALIGDMAFVGLMIPHIVRKIVGTDYRYILPISVFTGASFMLLADTIGRTIHAPYETPIVAVVAMLGLPFFLFVVRKGGQTLS